MPRLTLKHCLATRRAFAAGALAALAAPLPAMAADPLASGQFRDEVVTLLRRQRPKLRVELPPHPAALRVGSMQIYLANLYQSCLEATGARREALILTFFDAMTPAPDEEVGTTFEAARPRLRPRIITGAADRTTLLTRPFSDKTRIAYVIDNPQTMAFVSKGEADKWDVAVEAIHAAALENLDRASSDIPIRPQAPHSGSGLVVFFPGPDDYAAARLLAPKFMARIGEELGPEQFVAIPNRRLFLAWSVDCSLKRELAASVAHYAQTGPYPVTDELFVWSAEGTRLASPEELAEHGRG
jgi:hypothetical protein